MNARAKTVLLLAFLAASAAIWAVRTLSTATARKAELVATVRRQDELAAKTAQWEAQLRKEIAQAETVEADNRLLTEALEHAQAARRAQAPAVQVTREEVDARLKKAVAELKTGDPAALLREFLWCYQSLRQLGRGQSTVGMSVLIRAMGNLGERYPPALVALREWRAALRREVLAPGGEDAVDEFADVMHALKEDEALVAVYDQLPKDAKARASLAISGKAALIEARRYSDLYDDRTFSTMVTTFEATKGLKSGPSPAQIASMAAQNVEILAGVGALAQARDFIQRVLDFDRSETTRAALRQHLERGGHPELMPVP